MRSNLGAQRDIARLRGAWLSYSTKAIGKGDDWVDLKPPNQSLIEYFFNRARAITSR
jgi:hypothetical protein